MNIEEAIRTRKSVRGFKPDPVPKEILADILELAGRSPSAMNTQPWEFTVVTGDVLEKIVSSVVDKLHGGERPQPEHQVVGWSNGSVHRQRQVDLAKRIFGLMDIPRGDKTKRAQWMELGFRFFDAPAGIIMTTDRSLAESAPLLDIGAAMQTICLAALHHGLGTCIEDQSVMFPEVLRELAGIPESKRIIIAIAIGYPDPDFPANRLESPRESVKTTTTWLGF
ncbi:MAG: nitroreductase [Proteobacteria bacterium]|nr:nitroreductase [Pseudomonadota bacterium]